jgi:hypothetical protein
MVEHDPVSPTAPPIAAISTAGLAKSYLLRAEQYGAHIFVLAR